ncbi:MAG: NAD(P)H-dependent glycerol-3-phosphate dehydrogenase [Wenzhouxiangellaceae bacterium]
MSADNTTDTTDRRRIAVIGAGSWGTALAMQLARNQHEVVLWGRDAEAVAVMRERGENPRYLPGIPFPPGLRVSADLQAAVGQAEHVIYAGPSHAFVDQLKLLRPLLGRAKGLSWACKGFEPGSGRLLHEVAAEILGPAIPLGAITGPSFAREVAADCPTAVSIAASTEAYGEAVAALFHGGTFRAYYTDDLIGAGLGGAMKNVLAIATGVCDGMSLGHNARAGLITRGLAEMMRLGEAMGADPRTLMGLAGLGDLVLTCTGDLSRNRRLGLALGRGDSIEQALTTIGQVVEGVKTAEEVHRLAERHAQDLPICEQVYGILYRDWNPHKGLQVLLSRGLKREH